MQARVKFCEPIAEMFESGEIDENKIFFFGRSSFLVEWICQ